METSIEATPRGERWGDYRTAIHQCRETVIWREVLWPVQGGEALGENVDLVGAGGGGTAGGVREQSQRTLS